MTQLRLGRWWSVIGVNSLVNLIGQGMAVEKNGYFLHASKLRCQLAYVHSDVFCKNWWAKGSRKMILDEDLPTVLDCYIVDKMHLSYWKPDFRIYDFFQLASYLVDCYHLWIYFYLAAISFIRSSH